MLFSSFEFLLLFLPMAYVGFLLCGRLFGLAWQLGWLILCSLAFYGAWHPAYLSLLLLSIVCNYALANLLLDAGRSAYAGRMLLLAGLLFNLGLLAYFKYAGLLLNSLGWPTGEAAWADPVLPLAISFFTFQQIAFLVDCHRGLVTRIDPLRYCFFVSFFPQLIAGPIVHHAEIFPQLPAAAPLRAEWTERAQGVTRFLLGLSKKLLLADPLGQVVGPVFGGQAEGLTGLDYSVSLLAFSLQIYLDFSAYSDMAVGLGQLFGIRLPENFSSPYKARSISEFWRRWHMTLSRFLRDYLYIPLGGNRHGPGRRYLNLMLTMLLGGLWHGASWQFLWWGGLHGIFLVFHHGWRRLTNNHLVLPGWAGVALTFSAVTFAWLFFVTPSMDAAWQILALMTSLEPNNWGFSDGFLFIAQRPWFASLIGAGAGAAESLLLVLLLILAALLTLPNSLEFLTGKESGHGLKAGLRWTPQPAWAVILAPLLLASITLMQESNVFIYFQF